MIKALARLGWTVVRVSGGHHILAKPDCPPVTIPVKKGATRRPRPVDPQASRRHRGRVLRGLLTGAGRRSRPPRRPNAAPSRGAAPPRPIPHQIIECTVPRSRHWERVVSSSARRSAGRRGTGDFAQIFAGDRRAVRRRSGRPEETRRKEWNRDGKRQQQEREEHHGPENPSTFRPRSSERLAEPVAHRRAVQGSTRG